jgi:hypothetical protein
MLRSANLRAGLGVTNGLSNTATPPCRRCEIRLNACRTEPQPIMRPSTPVLTFSYSGCRAGGPPAGGRALLTGWEIAQRHEDVALLVSEVSPTWSDTPEAKPAGSWRAQMH